MAGDERFRVLLVTASFRIYPILVSAIVVIVIAGTGAGTEQKITAD